MGLGQPVGPCSLLLLTAGASQPTKQPRVPRRCYAPCVLRLPVVAPFQRGLDVHPLCLSGSRRGASARSRVPGFGHLPEWLRLVLCEVGYGVIADGGNHRVVAREVFEAVGLALAASILLALLDGVVRIHRRDS
jgi:hypothetical protein